MPSCETEHAGHQGLLVRCDDGGWRGERQLSLIPSPANECVMLKAVKMRMLSVGCQVMTRLARSLELQHALTQALVIGSVAIGQARDSEATVGVIVDDIRVS